MLMLNIHVECWWKCRKYIDLLFQNKCLSPASVECWQSSLRMLMEEKMSDYGKCGMLTEFLWDNPLCRCLSKKISRAKKMCSNEQMQQMHQTYELHQMHQMSSCLREAPTATCEGRMTCTKCTKWALKCTHDTLFIPTAWYSWNKTTHKVIHTELSNWAALVFSLAPEREYFCVIESFWKILAILSS